MSGNNVADHMLEGVSKAPVSSVSWAPQNGPGSLYLTTAQWDGNVSVYEVQHSVGNNNNNNNNSGGSSNRAQSRPLANTTAGGPVLSSVLTPNGECFFGGCDKGVYFWDVASGANPTQIGGHTLPVSKVKVLGPGSGGAMGTVVSASWDAKGCFWDPRQSSKVHEISQPGPLTYIDTVGPAVAFQSARSIALFDVRSMSIPMQIRPTIDPVQLQNRCCGLGSDLDFVVCGTIDGRIWRTNFEDNNKQDQFKAHGGQVRTNEFDAFPVNDIVVRGKTAISCSSDGTICFFDLSQLMKYNPTSPAAFPAPAAGTRAPITSISLSDDNHCLAYAVSEDYTLGHNVAMASRVVSKVCVKLITSELRLNPQGNNNNNGGGNNNNNRGN